MNKEIPIRCKGNRYLKYSELKAFQGKQVDRVGSWFFWLVADSLQGNRDICKDIQPGILQLESLLYPYKQKSLSREFLDSRDRLYPISVVSDGPITDDLVVPGHRLIDGSRFVKMTKRDYM